jgi:hypothetical protein
MDERINEQMNGREKQRKREGEKERKKNVRNCEINLRSYFYQKIEIPILRFHCYLLR